MRAQAPQHRRRVGRGHGPAARAARRHQADVAVLLHAEADRLPPLIGLVVVVAARVDADVAADACPCSGAAATTRGPAAVASAGIVARRSRRGARRAVSVVPAPMREPAARRRRAPPRARGCRAARRAPAARTAGASCSGRGRCRRPPAWRRRRARAMQLRPRRPTDAGARYVNGGRRIMDENGLSRRCRRRARPNGRLDRPRGVREREERSALGADARGLALALELEGLEHLVRRDRHLVDAHADRVVDRVGDGGDDGQQRPLPRFLGAERPLGIVGLDQDGVDLRRLERGRALVVEQRRDLVQALAGTPAPPSAPRRGPCRSSPRPGPRRAAG